MKRQLFSYEGGYTGTVETDRYGRKAPKMAHGSINLGKYTSSTRLIMGKVTELYKRIVDKKLTIRRMYVVAYHVMPESEVSSEPELTQISLFDDSEEIERRQSSEKTAGEKERRLQKASIEIRR